MKIGILTVAHRQVEVDYMKSMLALQRTPFQAELVFLIMSGHANVPRGRNVLVAQAKQAGCDAVVFVDSDIGFDPEEFAKLFTVPEGAKIVAGCPQRRLPDRIGFCGTMDPEDTSALGPLVSGYAATAFLRIDMDVFDDIRSEAFEYADPAGGEPLQCRSWFDYEVGTNPSGRSVGFIGEDFLFCMKAKEAGHTVWLRPGIKLRHWNTEPKAECMADYLEINGPDGNKLVLD